MVRTQLVAPPNNDVPADFIKSFHLGLGNNFFKNYINNITKYIQICFYIVCIMYTHTHTNQEGFSFSELWCVFLSVCLPTFWRQYIPLTPNDTVLYHTRQILKNNNIRASNFASSIQAQVEILNMLHMYNFTYIHTYIYIYMAYNSKHGIHNYKLNASSIPNKILGHEVYYNQCCHWRRPMSMNA